MKKVKLFLCLVLIIKVSHLHTQIVDLTAGLQAHYPFSANADDVSGNANNGTIFGSPNLTTDRFGNANSAYEFNGLDEYINTFSTFDYPNRSLSLWVEPYDISGSNTTINVAVTQDDDELNYGILRVDFNDNGMKLWAGGLTGTYADNSVSTNTWIHLVLIREANVSRYYVDNVLVHTSTADGTGSTFNPVPDFIIGCGRATTNQFFSGKIDDIRIYDRAINECEIQALFSENSSPLSVGLQAHYPFSANADDVSGNANDGTIFGSPTLTTDRFGNANAAYEFDGLDDYINTFSTFDYPDRTLSLWVMPYDISGLDTSINVAITQDDDELDYGILRVDFNDNGMKLWAGGLTGTYADNNVSTDAWMHLVLIREASVSRYYVDNVLVHTSTADGTGSTFNPVPDFIIGAGRATTNQFFSGKIDDIRVYDRAIHECEVDLLFNEANEITSIKDDLSSKDLIVFPNPTNDYVSIGFNSNIRPWKIEIIDSQGKAVQTSLNQTDLIKINMRDFSSGFYFIRVFLAEGIIVKKLIKK